MSKKKIIPRLQNGFTIIEVMIVLAIAGLIMVVVLVAVPQLQRSQRNNAATAVLDRVYTEMNNFSGNNRGNFPIEGNIESFCTRYLEKAACDDESGAEFINDPRTGTGMRIVHATEVSEATDASVPTNSDSRSIILFSEDTGAGSLGFRCDGENVVTANGGRQVAVVMPLEGGAVACRDNQ
jgi:prepilin-type N-terminal cleavage/methylation domain-containing protein